MIVAAVILAVGFVALEFSERMQALRARRGEPGVGEWLLIAGLSLASLSSVAQSAIARTVAGTARPRLVGGDEPEQDAVAPPDCPPVCVPEEIDISSWPTLAQEAAVLGCLLLGCHGDDQRERIVPPSPAERLADSVLGMGAPAGVIGNLFKKAGVPVADHVLHRLTERTVTRGISEEAALRAYYRGRLFYNPRSGNYIRYDSQTGVAVVVDKSSSGKVITVFEGNPSPDWTPVRWRYGK